LTKKTPCIGTIELAATGTQEGMYWKVFYLSYRFEEALFDFDKAISLEGSNPVIFSNRGLVNRKMERFAAAIQDYSNEINFSQTTNLQALNNRAYCFAKLGQYNEAIVDYTKVL
jgi:tetratricopeptide (TPR) repeat protein